MNKPTLLLMIGLVLMIGLSITISNVSATTSNSPSVIENSNNETQLISTPELLFQELNSKSLASIAEGWVYVKEIQKHDVDPLPNIQGLIPLVDTVSESWFYINVDGELERSITIERTMDGQVRQVGILSDGTAWNTVVDEIIRREPAKFEGIHYGLPYLHLKSPDMVTNESVKDGVALIEFAITITEKEPVDMLDYEQHLVAMEHHYIFDASTGFLVSKKTIVHLDDGTQRELDDIQVDVKIGVEPPGEILKYFVIKKEREEQK